MLLHCLRVIFHWSLLALSLWTLEFVSNYTCTGLCVVISNPCAYAKTTKELKARVSKSIMYYIQKIDVNGYSCLYLS